MEKTDNIVQILSIGHETSKELKKAVEILNLSQAEFHFSLIHDSKFENIEMKEIVKISKEVFKKEFGYHPLLLSNDLNVFSYALYDSLEVFLKDKKIDNDNVIYVINTYLFSDVLANLFTNIQSTENGIGNRAVITTFGVEEIFQNLPLEIYLLFWLIRRAVNFQLNDSHYHYEKKNCFFDGFIEKTDMVDVVRTGNICLDCQIKMDNFCDLNQILSINSILRIIGRISRSENPNQSLNDFYSISKFLSESKIKNTDIENFKIIESVVSKIIKTEPKNINELELDYSKLKMELGKGNTDFVFNELLSFLRVKNKSDLYNQLIVTYTQSNQLAIWKRTGQLTFEKFNQEISKITYSMLQIIDSIKLDFGNG